MSDYEILQQTVNLVVRRCTDIIAAEAKLIDVSPRTLHKEVAAVLGENAIGDGRACDWYVRVRLWDSTSVNADPEADTDPDAPADYRGKEIVHGLPSAAHFAAEMASKYHKTAPSGIGAAILKRKISSLRTQLSNSKRDNGWFNADYEVVETKFGSSYLRRMLLRCDVTKVNTGPDGELPLPTTNRVRLAGVRHTEGE